MYPFLRRYWSDLIPLATHIILLLFFLFAFLVRPPSGYPLDPFFTISALVCTAIVLITGPITAYTFTRKVRRERQEAGRAESPSRPQQPTS